MSRLSLGIRLAQMRALPVAALALWMLAALLTACEDEKRYYVENIGNGDRTPTMLTYDVKTYISDSGYTKYYIAAPEWSMYDEAKEPFWKFPRGVYLEQYDDSMKVVSMMRCDSAKYLSRRKIWRLDGHVMMVNTMNDTFLTKQVFWDQTRREVYSDSFIHIVRQQNVIEGKGFTSNERMTRYSVKNPQGIFPYKNDPTKASEDTPMPVDDSDTYDEGMHRNVAPPRASSRGSFNSYPFGESGPQRLPESSRINP